MSPYEKEASTANDFFPYSVRSKRTPSNIPYHGAATRLHLHGEPMLFKKLSDLNMESFSIYAPDPLPSMLQFDGITDLTVTHMEMSGQAEESALMQVHGVENFNMKNSTIEALTPKSLKMALQLFDGIEILSRPLQGTGFKKVHQRPCPNRKGNSRNEPGQPQLTLQGTARPHKRIHRHPPIKRTNGLPEFHKNSTPEKM